MTFNFNTFGNTPETNTTQKSGSGFDFNSFGTTTTTNPTVSEDQKSAQQYGALFPAKTGESSLSAGLKATGNIPSSALNLAKGIGNAILHPIQTIKSLGNVAIGGIEKLIPGTQAKEENFNQFASFLKERYGSLENLQRTATNDPFGIGTDVLMLLQGGAGVLGKTAELNKALSATAKVVTKPVGKVVEGVGNLVSKTTKFGVSQATGLNPETISSIIKNPESFNPDLLKTTTRTDVAGTVKEAIDARLDNLSDIGSGYETIRQTPSIVTIPQGTVESVLEKYGIKVVDGKVKSTAEAKPLTTADKTALEDFISVYGNEQQLSSNAFLNARSGLSQLSKYDAAKTGNLNVIARDLRGVYDNLGKGQIKGLAELDAKYAPEVKELNVIKKDYLQPDGSFKDGAVNKIANLTGVGKDQVLGRLEKIVPGVTQRIKILKAAEDLERASGFKVGTYLRAPLVVGGVLTGNIPAILSAIVASPEIAVKLLRAYGYTSKTAQPIIKLLYQIGNDVNNFRLPGQFQKYIEDYIKNPKIGATIEDISKNADYSSTPNNTQIKPTKNNAKITENTINPSISPKEVKSSLLEEAKKYKSAEEFVNIIKAKHRPPDAKGGSPLSDLTGTFPNDIYSDKANRLYGDYGMAGEKEAVKIIQSFKGKPNTEVTIYRAINSNEPKIFNGGDWVTISKDYAKQHGESNLEKGFKIISQNVKASEIFNDGNSILEWGYRPNGHTDLSRSQLTDIWKKANKLK